MNNSSHLTIFSNPLKPLPYIALLRLSMSYIIASTNNFIGFWPGYYTQNIRDFIAKKLCSGTFFNQYFLFIQLPQQALNGVSWARSLP
jgi:hypothetical protein